MRPVFALVLVLVLDVPATADDLDDDDDKPAPTWHASAGAGASLLFTGDGGDGTRFDGALSFQFTGSRFGILAAARAFDDEPRDILLTAGVEYQAAASRPRIVLTLYADAGVETAGKNPVLGLGTRTVFRVIGPLALIGDTGFHLVLDGLDDTTLVLGSALMLGVAR